MDIFNADDFREFMQTAEEHENEMIAQARARQQELNDSSSKNSATQGASK